MDLSNFRRAASVEPDQPTYHHHTPVEPNPDTPAPAPRPASKSGSRAWLLWAYIILFIIGMVSVYAVQNSQLQSTKDALAAAQKTDKPSSADIDGSKYQAVFLSSGQTYFGKVQSVDKQYLKLTDIYYLNDKSGTQDSQQKSTANTSLIKLGCEIHAPEDEMVINMNRVDFWENLQNSGDVVKGIKSYSQTHPGGQCS